MDAPFTWPPMNTLILLRSTVFHAVTVSMHFVSKHLELFKKIAFINFDWFLKLHAAFYKVLILFVVLFLSFVSWTGLPFCRNCRYWDAFKSCSDDILILFAFSHVKSCLVLSKVFIVVHSDPFLSKFVLSCSVLSNPANPVQSFSYCPVFSDPVH